MNEKVKKYLELENNKGLIGGQMPTERDLESFEKWKKRIGEDIRRLIVLSSCIVIIVYVCFLVTEVFKNAELKDKVFAIGCFFVFGCVEYVFIRRYLRLKRCKMESCNYGRVIDKYVVPKGRRRDYYVIVEVNSRVMKIRTKSEYSLLDVDDEAVVFSIEGSDIAYIMSIKDSKKDR